MTLGTKHRSTIFRALSPLLGEEGADALLAEFPAAEHDRTATTAIVRAELAELELRLTRRLVAAALALGGVVSASTAFLHLAG